MSKLVNNLNKDEYVIKKSTNKIKMVSKKKITEFKSNPKEFLENLNTSKLIDFLQELNYSYYIDGISLVNDELYDFTKEELRKRDSKHPLLKEVGVSKTGKTKLPYYMGSMDKIKNNEKELNNWIKKYNNENGYVLSDKLDGISGLLHHIDGETKLYTRGDGYYGQNITHLIKFINNIPDLTDSKEEITVRGELIITKRNFNKIKTEDNTIKNVRNAVAGIFNSKKPNLKIAKYIDFVAYECIKPDKLEPKKQIKKLKKLGFKSAYAVSTNNINNKLLSNTLVDRRDNSEYDIDGIIVSHNKYHKRINGENPKYAFAFKSIITSKRAEVLVLKVEWNLTKDDYLQPIVHFEPVEIDGVTIEKATGFNAKFIKDNKIAPGSIIVIIRSGDVIPKIEEIIKESEEPSMPTEYKWKWNETNVEILLDDTQLDDKIVNEKNFKELENFVLKIKFDKIGPGIVKKLFDSGINTIDKFLGVSKEELLKVPSIKEKTAENILKSIKNSMENLDGITLMSASNKLGRGFASKKIKLIVNEYPDIVNKNMKPTVEDLIKIKGIEKKTAEKFVNNFDNYLEFIKINKIKCTYKKVKQNSNEKIKFKKIVFTGFRSKELEEYIENNEGKLQDSISKNTDLLVIKDKDTSGSKVNKAKELNIKIITKKDFETKYNIE
jgi:NAD-dependent DNA ligase